MSDPDAPDPDRRDDREGGGDLGYRNVDEDATHDESPGDQGEGDAVPPSAA